jgi:hypothetical protein
MKLSHVLSAAGIFILAGCNGGRGGVEFDYVLLVPDPNVVDGVIAVTSCADVGVDAVRFAIGDDLNDDGILDEAEEIDGFEQFCNQNDDNGDGVIDENELGKVLVNRQLDTALYDSFSISFLDAAGDFVLWAQAPVAGAEAQTFTFQGANGTEITRGDILFLDFDGAGQVATERQAFFNF